MTNPTTICGKVVQTTWDKVGDTRSQLFNNFGRFRLIPRLLHNQRLFSTKLSAPYTQTHPHTVSRSETDVGHRLIHLSTIPITTTTTYIITKRSIA